MSELLERVQTCASVIRRTLYGELDWCDDEELFRAARRVMLHLGIINGKESRQVIDEYEEWSSRENERLRTEGEARAAAEESRRRSMLTNEQRELEDAINRKEAGARERLFAMVEDRTLGENIEAFTEFPTHSILVPIGWNSKNA